MNETFSYKIELFFLRILLKIGLLLSSKELSELSKSDRAELKKIIRLRLDADEQEMLHPVHNIRKEYSTNEQKLEINDYGAGRRRITFGGLENRKPIRAVSIAEIYRESCAPHGWALLLFRLIRWLKPQSCLELGANLGISACYIGAALELNRGGVLTTIEGDPTLSDIARNTFNKIGSNRTEVKVGKFSDVLPKLFEEKAKYNLVFIDGHHEEKATLNYFSMLEPHLTGRWCVVFDDIYPTSSVRKAWKKIISKTPDTIAINFFRYGILLKKAD